MSRAGGGSPQGQRLSCVECGAPRPSDGCGGRSQIPTPPRFLCVFPWHLSCRLLAESSFLPRAAHLCMLTSASPPLSVVSHVRLHPPSYCVVCGPCPSLQNPTRGMAVLSLVPFPVAELGLPAIHTIMFIQEEGGED